MSNFTRIPAIGDLIQIKSSLMYSARSVDESNRLITRLIISLKQETHTHHARYDVLITYTGGDSKLVTMNQAFIEKHYEVVDNESG